MKLETERLLLREMTENDLDDLKEILMDGPTMYAYEGAFTEEETRGWLEGQFRRYRENGFGLWAVVLKETGEMIGQCSLSWQDADLGEPVLEVGYLFKRKHWRRGYAAEAATTPSTCSTPRRSIRSSAIRTQRRRTSPSATV